MIADHCHVVSTGFGDSLKKWSRADYYSQHVHKMQLPFTLAPKTAPVDPEILKQRRQEMAKRLVEMNAKKREEKLIEDENLFKTLVTAQGLLEQGYEEKVRRMLSKHDVNVKHVKELIQLMEKVKSRIEKAKNPTIKKTSSEAAGQDEPEPKKRREEMNEEEKRDFDAYLAEIKLKRQELMDKRTARHFRKQQLAKRRTAASQVRFVEYLIDLIITHYSKSQIFVRKFNFDKTPNIFTSFSPKNF